jgi:hypothetical protein
MRAALQYIAASLCIGAIAFWGSENLFWSAPRGGMDVLDLTLTWLMYSLCCAVALSAVISSGLRGWRSLFLGGAILGWSVEGAIVSTAYDAFPAQLVWTGLAWHALITGLFLIGLCRAAVRWAPWKQAAALLAVACLAAWFGQYWPLERPVMAGPLQTVIYLFGIGLIVPIANVVLDRIGEIKPPNRLVLAAAPALVAAIWLLQTVFAPSPIRLSGPLLVVLTYWAMRRTGKGSPMPLRFGPPVPFARHMMFMLLPGCAALLNLAGWQFIGGMESNVTFALLTGSLSLGLWLWCIFRAAMAALSGRERSAQRL